jgi:hypothetical protein
LTTTRSATRPAQFFINCYWDNRDETPDTLARRCQLMLAGLAELHPTLAHWGSWGKHGTGPFAEVSRDVGTLRNRVEAGLNRGDASGEPSPWGGYSLFFSNDSYKGRRVNLRLDVGVHSAMPNTANAVTIDFNWRVDANEPVAVPLPPEIIIGVLHVLAEAWEPDIGRALEHNLLEELAGDKPRSYYPSAGWACYIPTARAAAVTPPAGVAIHPVPNRGVIWAAARDVFTMTDPAKVALVFQMERALAP